MAMALAGLKPAPSVDRPMQRKERSRRGSLIASALANSWRNNPPIPQISHGELTQIVPLLLQSGGAALGWWKFRYSQLSSSLDAERLHDAYRQHSLSAALREREINKVFTLLRSAGIDPILGKGWAIARLYPAHGLRPYGDIDLYIRPEDYSAASHVLATRDNTICSVDLHQGPAELDDRTFDDLYERSQLVSLGEVEVRIFGPEDHLRLLCLHTLRHGAWRPLWLCDIAAALESRPGNFDWDRALYGSHRRTDWVACAIGLAHQLLGVRVDDTPVQARAMNLPRWLLPTVLSQWGAGQTPHGSRSGMRHYFRNPAGVLKAIRIRWPNAIEATVYLRGPFNDLPRLPFQIGDAVLRTAKFLTQFPGSLRQQY